MSFPLFFLNVLAFALGIFNVIVLAVIRVDFDQRGLRRLLLPLIPLALMTLLLIFHLYVAHGGVYIAMGDLWQLAYETCRILIAMAWIYVTYYHYDLNDVEVFRKRQVMLFLTMGCLLWIYLIIDAVSAADLKSLVVNNYLIVGILFFAGVKGASIRRRKQNLLASTGLAVKLAILSLVIYPGIAIGDALGWSIPFLDSSVPIWVQAHPLYYLVLNGPVFYGLIVLLRRRDLEISRGAAVPVEEAAGLDFPEQYGLTERECEIFKLVIEGLRNQRIADILYLSLPTVKTHVSRIYQKTGVKSRAELFAKFSSEQKEASLVPST